MLQLYNTHQNGPLFDLRCVCDQVHWIASYPRQQQQQQQPVKSKEGGRLFSSIFFPRFFSFFLSFISILFVFAYFPLCCVDKGKNLRRRRFFFSHTHRGPSASPRPALMPIHNTTSHCCCCCSLHFKNAIGWPGWWSKESSSSLSSIHNGIGKLAHIILSLSNKNKLKKKWRKKDVSVSCKGRFEGEGTLLLLLFLFGCMGIDVGGGRLKSVFL